jgi:hypothetical protein
MLSHNELTKKDTGEKGKPALFYYSTEYSRKRRKLEILRPFSKQMDEVMKVYAKVFFFSIIGKNTCDIKDLDRFLADLGSSRDKLIPDIVRCLDRSKGVFVGPMVIIDQEIPPWILRYHPSEEELTRAVASILKPEAIILPTDKISSSSTISHPRLRLLDTLESDYDPFILYEIIHKPIDGITVIQKEYDLRSFDPESKAYIVYEAHVPGISVSEFIGEELEKNNAVLGPQEVQVRFERLEQAGLLTRYARKVNGELRYIIADSALSDLMIDLQYLLELENKYFDFEFQYFRRPNPEERKRLSIIYGKRDSNIIVKSMNLARNKFRNELIKIYGQDYSRALDIVEDVRKIRGRDLLEVIDKIRTKHRSTIQRYEYFYDIIGMIYPTLLTCKT